MLFLGLVEWRKSVFGLERRLAQRRLISSSTGLILVFLLLLGEFLLIAFIDPRLPANPNETSEMLNPLPEPTNTLNPDDADVQLPLTDLDENVVPDQIYLEFECLEDRIEIIYPTDGSVLRGSVKIIGSVNVDNFGSYKYEYSPTGNINWTTIAAGNQLKLKESIGFWYTSTLIPGHYLLRLVPLDNTGKELTPCIVTVEVIPED
jgi:hypothetical protein